MKESQSYIIQNGHYDENLFIGDEGSVELTSDEVKTLVDLIQENGTSDVEELELEENYPDIYEKLDDACRSMAFAEAEYDWFWEGYSNGFFEYDTEALLSYCKEHCGYVFEYDPEDYQDDDGNLDEEEIHCAELEDFEDWLSDYLESMNHGAFRLFAFDHLCDDPVVECYDYDVVIPDEIVEMAK